MGEVSRRGAVIMPRRLRALSGAVVCLVVLVPPARASLNDSDTARSEQDIRSRYSGQPPPSRGPSTRRRAYALLVIGAVLLLGAFCLSLLRLPRWGARKGGQPHASSQARGMDTHPRDSGEPV